jgi:cytidine deaminase
MPVKREEITTAYQVYDSIDELDTADAELLRKAIAVSAKAYAPYSHFHVGAVAKLTSGEYIHGTNQENASYPVGICAERVLLASASTMFPDVPIETMAISYKSEAVKSDHPIAPCGMCRQSLHEYESRMKHPIRLILGGIEGKIYVIPTVTSLLPFSFSGNDLKTQPV